MNLVWGHFSQAPQFGIETALERVLHLCFEASGMPLISWVYEAPGCPVSHLNVQGPFHAQMMFPHAHPGSG